MIKILGRISSGSLGAPSVKCADESVEKNIGGKSSEKFLMQIMDKSLKEPSDVFLKEVLKKSTDEFLKQSSNESSESLFKSARRTFKRFYQKILRVSSDESSQIGMGNIINM